MISREFIERPLLACVVSIFIVIAAGFILLTLPTGLAFGALAKRSSVKR